jgi:hypothetical protein
MVRIARQIYRPFGSPDGQSILILFKGPHLFFLQNGPQGFQPLIRGWNTAINSGLEDSFGYCLRCAAHIESRLDMQLQFLEAGKHRQGRNGYQLAGLMGYLLAGVHLAGNEKRQVFGQVFVERVPQIKRAFVGYPVKVKLGRFFCFLNNILAHSRLSLSGLGPSNSMSV